MSTLEKKLYKEITVKGNTRPDYGIGEKTYKGFSTVNPDTTGFQLYDIQLVKQDIINHFHIRQGELLSNPNFGTIIWDILYEPLTENLKQVITENVGNIINYDPRVTVTSVTVDQYESGLQIDCTLVFLPYNIAENMQLTFDQNNGLLAG
jgi:phage baseplate assembly protein W|tara:strand:+ start:6017 stop:6466 length:450 start_codon:yes stop_codon:yes gene_type:complete